MQMNRSWLQILTVTLAMVGINPGMAKFSDNDGATLSESTAERLFVSLMVPQLNSLRHDSVLRRVTTQRAKLQDLSDNEFIDFKAEVKQLSGIMLADCGGHIL